MDQFWSLFFYKGNFLGIEWHLWKIVGWLGNVVFSVRFLVQWYATEKHKRVVVPQSFWWLSLIGSLLLLTYALFFRKDSVFIFAYLFNWIPYMRNLIIHRRHQQTQSFCTQCSQDVPPGRFCLNCGKPLDNPQAQKI